MRLSANPHCPTFGTAPVLSRAAPSSTRPHHNPSTTAMSTLSADYASPNGTQNFSAQLPAASASSSTADRVAYFGDLQTNLKTLQTDINAFLTQKMADDKAGDTKEEANYGEEVVEED